MESIVLTINNNVIIFDYRVVTNEEKKLRNKNTISKDSLFYTIKYFKSHINNICEYITKTNNGINTMHIQKLVTFKYPFMLFEGLKLTSLVFNFISTIDVEDYELFLTSKYLKNLDCYFMPSVYDVRFKEKNIIVKEFCTKKVSSKFMSLQGVIANDSLYFKKTINITEDYDGLIEDLEEFFKINYKLKAIHLYVFSVELISSIVDIVKHDESRNVVVFLHQGHDKGNFIVNNFKWLKALSDKCKEDYLCEFRIVYSSSFLKNNLFKQLTFNNLKLISILCIYVSIVCIMLIKSYEYIEKLSIDQLTSDLISDSYGAVDDEDHYVPDALEEKDEISNMTKEEVKKRYNFSRSFSKLRKINKETVGYLVVNNTEISYPVVQHSDNSYYLKRDFYKRTTSMGWIYLDYRNNLEKLDDNSIIYGHSMLNGTMFGTLKKVLSSSWRKVDENMVITLENENDTMKFRIFSAYKVDYTTDYLKTNFSSKKEKEEFIKLIRGRSIFKSNVEVDTKSKILTLSTCTGGNNKRLVVHAVLIGDE